MEHESELAAATDTDADKMKLEALNPGDVATPWPWFSNKRKLLEKYEGRYVASLPWTKAKKWNDN